MQIARRMGDCAQDTPMTLFSMRFARDSMLAKLGGLTRRLSPAHGLAQNSDDRLSAQTVRCLDD